jgi:dihydrofolate reductase
MSQRGKIIVIQFITLDGVVEDPDGRSGTDFGGWAFRFGADAIAGDKFGLGPIMDSGALLFGRGTWEHFSRLWPQRTDPFSLAMNAIPKHVVSRGAPDVSVWSNSHHLGGDPIKGAVRLAERQDLVVVGSTTIVRALAAAGVVEEYRLLCVPTFVGAGETLFDTTVPLRQVSVTVQGSMTLGTYVPVRV